MQTIVASGARVAISGMIALKCLGSDPVQIDLAEAHILDGAHDPLKVVREQIGGKAIAALVCDLHGLLEGANPHHWNDRPKNLGPFNYLGSCGTLKERYRHEWRNDGLPWSYWRPVGESFRKIAIGKGNANLKEQVCPAY